VDPSAKGGYATQADTWTLFLLDLFAGFVVGWEVQRKCNYEIDLKVV
jgi:hypothetical protein